MSVDTVKFDHDKFLFLYEQEEFGALNDHQRAGLFNLLSAIESDEHVTDHRWVAYMLATVKHETADTFLPIAEYGHGKGKPYGHPVNGCVFYGRGYCQLTWDYNYETMGRLLNVDLLHNPDLALQPDIAYQVMSWGMRKGMFTGVGLAKYINTDGCDYHSARKIINGLDCADKIADYAVKFERIVTGATI